MIHQWFVYFRNNNLKFNRIILNGSAEIDRNIADEFSLEEDKAEQLEIKL